MLLLLFLLVLCILCTMDLESEIKDIIIIIIIIIIIACAFNTLSVDFIKRLLTSHAPLIHYQLLRVY